MRKSTMLSQIGTVTLAGPMVRVASRLATWLTTGNASR